MEVPRLGVESELQLPAYTRATATRDPSHVCDLHHSSWHTPHRILNPLNKARDQTHNLVVPSQIRELLSHDGDSSFPFFIFCLFRAALKAYEGSQAGAQSEQ